METDVFEPQGSIELSRPTALQKLSSDFFSCHDGVHAFAEFIVQKNRTAELKKQLNTKMRVMDAQLEEYREQTRIKLQEYAVRLDEELNRQRCIFELEIQKELAAYEQQCQTHRMQFQEYMERSQTAQKTLQTFGDQLLNIHRLLDMAKADGSDSNKYYLLLSERYRLCWRSYTKIARAISQ